MSVTTSIKNRLNAALRPFNVRLDSWTAFDLEQRRIAILESTARLSSPLYPLTKGMQCFDPSMLGSAFLVHQNDVEKMKDPRANDTGYDPDNAYFSTPDAEALYLMIRSLKPRRVVEIGCGNSTRITRQAIIDGALDCELVAIDPEPRIEIADFVDRIERRRVETIDDVEKIFSLQPNDILFIDSSHIAAVGNDVAAIFCRIIPKLAAGVIIHVHDVFLPYEYPPHFAKNYSNWGEQYVLHALVNGRDCEVLWPGYHLQRDRPELHNVFPFLRHGRAQSFWFRWC